MCVSSVSIYIHHTHRTPPHNRHTCTHTHNRHTCTHPHTFTTPTHNTHNTHTQHNTHNTHSHGFLADDEKIQPTADTLPPSHPTHIPLLLPPQSNTTYGLAQKFMLLGRGKDRRLCDRHSTRQRPHTRRRNHRHSTTQHSQHKSKMGAHSALRPLPCTRRSCALRQ